MRHALAVLLVCLAGRQVGAIEPPLLAGPVMVIQTLLDNSNDLDDKVRKQEALLENMRSSIEPNSKIIARYEKQIAALKQERDLMRSMAIHEALRVYRIVPVDANGRAIGPTGTIVVPDPASNGKKAHWIPIARDNEPRSTIDAEGDPRVLPKAVDSETGEEPEAVAYFDGVAAVFSNVRTEDRPYGSFGSSADLALTLYHELVHFEQYTTVGQGDKMTPNEREVAAWRATAAAAGRLGVSAEKEQELRDHAHSRMTSYQAAVRGEAWKKLLPIPRRWRWEEPSYLLPHTPEELGEIKKGATDLAEAMADAREKARRKREKLEKQLAREEAERRRREEERERRERERLPEAPMLSAREIKRAVLKACENPWSEEAAGLVKDRLWLPEADGWQPGTGSDLTGCARDLWDLLMRTRGKMLAAGETYGFPLEAFREAAARVRAPHLPPEPMAAAYLAALARNACEYNEGGKRYQEKEMRSFLGHWFPDPRIAGTGQAGMNLTGCARDLYEDLLRFNRTWGRWNLLSIDWLNWRAARLAEKHSAPPSPSPPPQPEGGGDAAPEPDRWPGKGIDVPTLDEILKRLDRR